MLATNARAAVLAFLRTYIHAHGDSPSMDQISQNVGISKPHVKDILDRLERDRVIRRLEATGPRRKRRIVLTEKQASALATLRALGWTVNDALRTVNAPS